MVGEKVLRNDHRRRFLQGYAMIDTYLLFMSRFGPRKNGK